MGKRNGLKIGDWLVQDDLTGEQVYASKTVKDYRGNVVARKNFLKQNPQDFLQVIDENPFVNPARARNVVSPLEYYSDVVGDTAVPAPQGAASHLFDSGVGQMIIGTTFRVR